MLELPHSSNEARVLQILLLFLISLSMFTLYTQTVTTLTPYGPRTAICGKTVAIYCGNKYNSSWDPGCFQQSLNGTVYDSDTNLPIPLQYHYKDNKACTAPFCYGRGNNFGSPDSLLSCGFGRAPFQDTTELWFNYGPPYTLHTRKQMHEISAICGRIECTDNSDVYYDGNAVWIVLEFCINIIFTIEFILRVLVADSLFSYMKDKLNFFDILSIVPFYTELIGCLTESNGIASLNFSILSSSPEPIFLVAMRSFKMFRMFKLTRHFQASKVLTETARKVWRQLLGMLSLLIFFTILFAILLYEVERGDKCYVGGTPEAELHGNICEFIPEKVADLVHPGDLLFINKDGNLSQFPNVFYGIWFCFVTLTTTGYGDIVPVTNAGQCMTIFLMVAGTFYMAMPLTAASGTFTTVHEKYENKLRKSNPSVSPSNSDGSFSNPNESEKGIPLPYQISAPSLSSTHHHHNHPTTFHQIQI
jgi:hypothetical protein